MMKRILSVLLVLTMMFSLVTIVNAEALQTFTLGEAEIDATALNVGDTLSVPVTATAFPADVIYAGQLDVTFDYKVLKIKDVTPGIKGEDEYGDSTTIRWSDAAAISNANTTGSIAFKFLDTDKGLSKKYTTKKSGILFTINFEILADTANTTISLTNAKLSDYSTGSEVKYEVANGKVAVSGDSTVKFVEDKPAVSVAWTTETEVITGAMRFLFDAVVTGGDVVASGVKFLNSNNFEDVITSIDKTGAVTTFSADVNEIPEGTTGTYYAAGYVKIGDDYKWEIVGCTLN